MTDGPVPDAGRISRRALLAGGAGAALFVAAGGFGGEYELNHHPTLRKRLFGCGSTPAIPQSDYTITTGTIQSSAMQAAIPWEVALPAGADPSARLPLVLALPGEGGNERQFATDTGLPGYATAAGLRLCFVSSGAVDSCYYHPRADGTDYFAFLVNELIPTVERRFRVGGDRSRRATYGSSMGGFGALLVAQQRPDLICAAVGSSPAVFPSYAAAITGHPHTFDSEADWQRWGLWDHTASMGRVPVRIDCGNADPFFPTAKALISRIPGATGQISSGCHEDSFWRRHATAQLQFLGQHLTTAR